MHLMSAVLAVPAEFVDRVLWTMLLDDDADGVRKAHRVVRCVWWQQEHLAFVDVDVFELAIVDGLEKHSPLVLVEPLRRLVDVKICPGVWTSDNLIKLDETLIIV